MLNYPLHSVTFQKTSILKFNNIETHYPHTTDLNGSEEAQLKAYNLSAQNKAATIGLFTSVIPVVPSPSTNLDSINKIIIDIFENET
jgi:hypothetical protein